MRRPLIASSPRVRAATSSSTARNSGRPASAFAGFSLAKFQLNVHGDQITVPFPQDFRSTADADLVVQGDLQTQLIRGTVNLRRTEYTKNIELADLINRQPGWLYEANGVLHPRGSEYDVQFVADGVPMNENRSPAFAPNLEADDVESMRVITAGYLASDRPQLPGFRHEGHRARDRRGADLFVRATG